MWRPKLCLRRTGATGPQRTISSFLIRERLLYLVNLLIGQKKKSRTLRMCGCGGREGWGGGERWGGGEPVKGQ